MNPLSQLYRTPLALLTDFYQLTMAYAYWKDGAHDREAVFSLFFRANPFRGGYTIAGGLEYVIDYLSSFRFDAGDIDFLAGLCGNDDKPLFDRGFLDHLRGMELCCDIDAVPEGTVVFPQEPLVRVRGPLAQCQLLETALLNMINYQTLVATKAARVCQAAQGDPVLEFGLRRAQGIDGGIAASRAAYLGGCAATSNVLAGRLFGIPVRGTHAHSWVMSFEDETESFRAYARALPNNCVFLVDTYDSLDGVRRAIEVGRELRSRGYRLGGVRLDSGDLAYLSIEARKILDDAGFRDTAIFASNDLDEHIIESLKIQGARIAVWGVGTKLATAYDQPALGGVYKLTALREPSQKWRHVLKLSEQSIKVSTPGILATRRFEMDGQYLGDAIYDELLGIPDGCTIVDPMDMTRRKRFPVTASREDLLKPIFRQGKLLFEPPPLEQSRAHVAAQLARLHGGIKRFVNPHQYPVGLEQQLHELKTALVLKARERSG